MSTIRLVLNNQLNDVLDYLKEEYSPLSKAEILKLGVAELFNKTKKKNMEILDSNSANSLKQARNEMDGGDFETFNTVDELIQDLNG